MLSAASATGTIVAGLAAGLQFNPLVAAGASAVAAALSGYPRAPRSHLWWSAAVLLAGWVIGDGISIAGSSTGGQHAVLWALVGLGVGYVAPTVLASYVGRQVHKGTGYLSAAAVALMLAPALAALAEVVSKGLWGLVA